MQPPDAELIAQAKSGDKQAFVVLFQRYKNRIYAYLARYLRDEETAQDLTLETFLAVYNNLQSYTEEGAFLPWVYKIATNLAKREFRRKRIGEISLDEPVTESGNSTLGDMIADELNRPDHNAMKAEVVEILERALQRLSEKYRQAVLLCDIEGLTYEEAARVLNSNAKTVGTHLLRARKVLFKYLLKYKQDLRG